MTLDVTVDWPRLLRDPLLHFAVAGTLLFAVLPGEADGSREHIAVSRADLIGYMQGRARLFDGRTFEQAYDALSPAERGQLLSDFVRQEALYREARALGLDEADPLVRSRLVQQMDLLLRDQALGNGSEVSDSEVEAYFAAHQSDYGVPAAVSFTHVFLDAEKHGAATERLAREELAHLRQQRVAPEDALERGDRFPYQRNYAAMTAAALAPETGDTLAQAAFRVPTGQWAGPFASPLGQHLIWVSRRSPAVTPQLAQVRDQVASDALQARRNELGEAAVQRVLATYQVDRASDLGETAEPPR